LRGLLLTELGVEGRVDGDGDPDVAAEALGQDPLEIGTEPGLELTAGEVVRYCDDRSALVQGHRTRVGQPGALVRREACEHAGPGITKIRHRRCHLLLGHRLVRGLRHRLRCVLLRDLLGKLLLGNVLVRLLLVPLLLGRLLLRSVVLWCVLLRDLLLGNVLVRLLLRSVLDWCLLLGRLGLSRLFGGLLRVLLSWPVIR
jgi:hypothetical protein